VGAGARTGFAAAMRFGRKGEYRVALLARNPSSLKALVERLRDYRVHAEGFPTDAGDPSALRGALEEAMATFGKPTVLIYNATGSDSNGHVEDFYTGKPATTIDAFETSVLGPLTSLRIVVPAMRDAGQGVFIVSTCPATMQREYSPRSLSHPALERLVSLALDDPRTSPVRVVLAQLAPSPARGPWESPQSLSWIAAEYWSLVHERQDVVGKVFIS
jgi:NAD(P)-dependent dehydrogenase (short-subunit alcohol dehydrogenase family)